MKIRLLAPIMAVASVCCYGQCPLKFETVTPGTLMTWGNVGKRLADQIPSFKVKVQNVSGTAIRGLKIQAGYWDATEDLFRIPVAWNWNSPIKAGSETTLHWENAIYAHTSYVGWVVTPIKVLFEDGSTWDAHAESMAGCYGEYWRDKKHPRLTALPPELLKPAATNPQPEK
jgi:hypothetical protein